MNKQNLNIGICCYPTYGGSGVIAAEIGMALAKRGHKVHFIAYDIPRRIDRFTKNIFFHEVEMRDYPLFIHPQYPLSLASKIVEVCTFEKLDILHVHYAVPHATSAYLAKQILGDKAPKIITTLHGTDITLVGSDRSYLPIVRFSIEQSDGVTVPSHYLRNATYDKINISTDKPVEVIYNFIDTEKYAPRDLNVSASLYSFLNKCTKNDKILVHTSNFRPVKRIGDVIKIFSLINKTLPAHLILIGDGPERAGAESLARELGVFERVNFLGKLESFVEILQQSDLFLLPSESESFGLAALEAMSCGVPVIASNTQGIPELVNHGKDGFLSDVGNVEEMAANALRLLNNSKLWSSFSKAARETAVNNFKLENIIEQYENYYYSNL